MISDEIATGRDKRNEVVRGRIPRNLDVRQVGTRTESGRSFVAFGQTWRLLLADGLLERLRLEPGTAQLSIYLANIGTYILVAPRSALDRIATLRLCSARRGAEPFAV